MQLKNYYQNQKLIDEGRPFDWHYFLIESDGIFNSLRTPYFEIFSMEKLDLSIFDIDESNPQLVGHLIYPMNENKPYRLPSTDLKKKIEAYQSISHLYLLRIKLVSMEGSIDDPTTITVLHAPDICSHVLTLLSLSFRPFYFRNINITLSLRINYNSLPKIEEEDKRLIYFDKNICYLREKQFLLVMNSLSFFNLSKIMSHTDAINALSVLCSSIESFSQIYSIKKNFQTHPVGESLLKHMQDAQIPLEKIELVMKSFGKYYEDQHLYQTTQNFEKWCESMLEKSSINKILLYQTEETKKIFNKLISSWYKIRSTTTHGILINTNCKRNVPIHYTELNRSKNIKKRTSLINLKVMIPQFNEMVSYNEFLDLTGTIIENSIELLKLKIDDPDDVDLYNHFSLLEKENSIRMCLKKTDVKPLSIVRLGIDTYKSYSFRDHYNNLKVLAMIFDNFQQGKYPEALKNFKHLTNLGEMTDENLFLKLFFYLSEICNKINNYIPIIEFVDQAEININSSRYWLLNDKAYYLSKMGNYEDAHTIIDQIIKKELSSKNKSKLILFYDTKGDIYRDQLNTAKALEYYEKSLELGESEYSTQTREKISLIRN